jgi:hypothetical protein
MSYQVQKGELFVGTKILCIMLFTLLHLDNYEYLSSYQFSLLRLTAPPTCSSVRSYSVYDISEDLTEVKGT